jgi:hypothetical protein
LNSALEWARDVLKAERITPESREHLTTIIAALAPRTAFAEAIEAAAKVALDGCLVPPDGGSPTEGERLMCEEIARRIRAITPPESAA